MRELSYVGVGCYVQLRDKKPIGISYSLGMHKFPASKLGIGYTFRNIQGKGIFYNESEHFRDIEQLNSLENKLTSTIENGFISENGEDNRKSNYLLLIPNINNADKKPEPWTGVLKIGGCKRGGSAL